MRTASIRATRLLAIAGLALATGCGSGGFGSSVAPPTPKPITNYVAIGDGFASGPYLGPDSSGTGCLRSSNNYPAQVARDLQVRTLTDVTCTGATTRDLTGTSNPPRSSKKLAPQLDAVTRDTDLVTLGIGIEDNGFLRGMFNICTAEPCGSDVLFPVLAEKLDAYASAVNGAVRTIQEVAPAATIVIVGYPQIMPPTGLCAALPRVSELQLGYSFKLLETLNQLLRSAAGQAGASFIDVAALSPGHTACSSEPWVNGSKTKVGTTQAFHPVAAEQAAVAEAIANQVRAVSAPQE